MIPQGSCGCLSIRLDGTVIYTVHNPKALAQVSNYFASLLEDKDNGNNDKNNNNSNNNNSGDDNNNDKDNNKESRNNGTDSDDDNDDDNNNNSDNNNNNNDMKEPSAKAVIDLEAILGFPNQNNNDNENANDAKEGQLLRPSTSSIVSFFKALEGHHEIAGQVQLLLKSRPPIPPSYFYVLQKKFACHDSLLQVYVQKSTVQQRLELCTYLQQQQQLLLLLQQQEHSSSGSSCSSQELETLLQLPGFFKDMTRSSIPLDTPCACASLTTSILLLKAFDDAKLDGWSLLFSSVAVASASSSLWATPTTSWKNYNNSNKKQQQQASGSDKNSNPMQQKPKPQRLTPQNFALLTLQQFCSSLEAWNQEAMQLILRHLHSTPPPRPPRETKNNNNKKNKPLSNESDNNDESEEKPPIGLEAWMSHAMTAYNLDMPPILKQWPGLNVAKIAPALFETQRLVELATLSKSLPLSSYPNPQVILQTIMADWTPEQVCRAIEEDQGGLGRLLDAIDDMRNPSLIGKGGRGGGGGSFSWLAEIPVLVEARNVAQGLVQVVLFRTLFLHVQQLDIRLSPELLGTLPLADYDLVRARAIEHAVQYLEAGIDSPIFVKLPWKTYGTKDVMIRVVRALHDKVPNGDESLLWKQQEGQDSVCIDLTLLDTVTLEQYVPPRVLAAFALRNYRQLTTQTTDVLLEKVSQLEMTMSKLQCKIKDLEHWCEKVEMGSESTSTTTTMNVTTLTVATATADPTATATADAQTKRNDGLQEQDNSFVHNGDKRQPPSPPSQQQQQQQPRIPDIRSV